MPRLSASSHSAPAAIATVVDGSSLFDAAELIGANFGRSKVTIDYPKLHDRLQAMRTEHAGWSPASFTSILLSIDPNSEGQMRFQAMLRHAGFEPEIIPFWNAFVLPPGRNPPGRRPADGSAKAPTSLSSRIAYLAGLAARNSASELLVVSHSLELKDALTDLARRLHPQGKVGLAYFGSLLDERWGDADLREGKLGIEFFDLDPFGNDLVGVELVGRTGEQQQLPSVFKRF